MDRFPPCCPDGRVTNVCARTVYAQRVEQLYRLSGDWTGWRLKAGKLHGPGGITFTPATLALAWKHLQSGFGRIVAETSRQTGTG
jgi:hypothetical protein